MAYINYPLLGDPVYGGRARVPAGVNRELIETIRGFRRQALHAEKLSFTHPSTREAVSFEAPLPADFRQLLAALERYD
jgi:23S rRNA pseudouridine1911/1915/1917 synthase